MSDQASASSRRACSAGPGPSRRRRGAFTLIEMLTLIVIMAVLSGVAVPAYSRFYAKARFDQCVGRAVEVLAWARDAAIEHGTETSVRYDAQNGVFRASVDGHTPDADVPAALQQDSPTASAESSSRSCAFPEDVAASAFEAFEQPSAVGPGPGAGAAAEFRFHDDGTSSGGRFAVLSQAGYGAMVQVSPLTGRAVILDEPDESTTGR